jgi:hypothetical protein
MMCEQYVKRQCEDMMQDIELHIIGLFTLLSIGVPAKEHYIQEIKSYLRKYEYLKTKTNSENLYLERLLKIESKGYLI